MTANRQSAVDGQQPVGDDSRTAIDALSYVTRSPNRVAILGTLFEAEEATRATLLADADVVRTTLQRNLDGLAERGLVRGSGRTYELTPTGTLFAPGLFESLTWAEAAVRLRPVLDRLSMDDLGFDLERLADATVYEATTSNPYRPVERHSERLTETDRARLVLPTVGSTPAKMAREAATAETVYEMVVTPAVLRTMRTDPAISAAVDPLDDTAQVSIGVYDGSVAFCLGVLDDTVHLCVHDENGVPSALLETTDAVVREWAIERFQRFRDRSESVDLDRPNADDA